MLSGRASLCRRVEILPHCQLVKYKQVTIRRFLRAAILGIDNSSKSAWIGRTVKLVILTL